MKPLLWLVLLAIPTTASAQLGFVGPGSTVQGDMLRGAGVFLNGAGLYNYYSAMAGAIETQTWMTLNEYIYQSIRFENQERARRRAERFNRTLDMKAAIIRRYTENPERYDVTNGNALNARMDALLTPTIHPSVHRMSRVALEPSVVRKIPFKLASKNVTVSLLRASIDGKWPLGLRGPEFASDRKAYKSALDEVLELQIEGKTSRSAIAKLEKAVNDLRDHLDQVVKPVGDQAETIYNESKNFLVELERAKETMKFNEVEKILGELDRYAGETIYDLLDFMRAHKLQFDEPKSSEERRLYPLLFESMKTHMDSVTGLSNNGGAAPPRADRGPIGDR